MKNSSNSENTATIQLLKDETMQYVFFKGKSYIFPDCTGETLEINVAVETVLLLQQKD